MKRSLLFFLTIPLLFSGCSRWMYDREDKLIGNWKLVSASKLRSFKNSKVISTGYEDGMFTFYDNGQARYSEGQVEMEGSWQLRSVSHGGYDINGNHSSNSSTVLSVHLVDFRSNKVLNLDFDDCWFKGRNRFTAEYETFSYYYRYIFDRY